MGKKTFQPDRILSYFHTEGKVLAIITISGLVYNLGLLAGPWFEGRMAETLVRILQKDAVFFDMLVLVCSYIAATALVQWMRYVKRFYVRRFANNVNRRMKETLYGNLVCKSRRELEQEGIGSVLTKAILDVDDCAEGMRKFTTEVFDTGVALVAYAGMLLWYDWRLALLCMIFPPVSYILAEKMKVVVQRIGAVYKEQSDVLSAATMDRASNALTYRIFGREQDRQQAYERELERYENAAIKANIWSSSLPPIYKVISMAGAVFILYFGSRNVLGTGWNAWSIAEFTTFLACFTKLAAKSTLGQVFLCEYPYGGQLRFGDRGLKDLSPADRAGLVGYLGHDPELFSASIAENILLSSQADPEKYLRLVCLDKEVAAMPDGVATRVGTGGVRLSGGQAQRLALARTLCHKRPLLVLAILAAVAGASGAALVPPLVLGRIVDALVNGQAVPLSRIALYFAFIALTGLLESLRESALTVFGQKVTHALRSRLMEKQVHLTTDTLNRQEPGILVSRFVGDVDTVENLFTSGIISMAADACKLLSILAVVWSCNRGLAYVLLALLPLLFVFTRSVQKRMLAAQLANRQVVGRASGYVPETLHNIRTIHSLGKENYMEQRYDQAIGESYRAIERTNFYSAVCSPVVLTLNAVVVAVVMLLSASGSPAVLTLFGMSAGTAVTVINYISQIFSPVESLGMEIQTIQSAASRSFWHRRNFPHSLPPPVKNPQAPFVELRDVTFGYDEQETVLRHLSFQVEAGEQVTLTGRTGAGKSTVFKLLLGLYAPQEGAVLLQGIPVSEIPEAERRKLFGCVEQSFHRVPGTVRDQITLYDASITEEQIRAAARLAGLEDAINGLEHGYDTSCTPELFSQGQWQLLSIARAIAADPKLLLDEITANLDAETEHAVLQALRRASSNRTVISISHRTGADMGRLITIGALADSSNSAAT